MTALVADEDTDCSGAEATYDSTCLASRLDVQGELSRLLDVYAQTTDCGTSFGTATRMRLSALDAGGSIALGSLAAGSVLCVVLSVEYSTNSTWLERQIAQTDQATWMFAFDATE
jgi:hypothetical protein